MFAIYYKAFFRLTTRIRVCRLHNTPHFEYAIQACLFAGADCFEPTHLLAKRLVKGFHRLFYEKRLGHLGLQCLSRRLNRGDLITTYNVFGCLRLDPSLFCIPVVQPGYKGLSFKVLHTNFNTVLIRNAKFWNRLLTTFVTDPSVSSCKRQLNSM